MPASTPIDPTVSPSRRTPLALLTPTEVASILSIDPRTVRRWARDGRLQRVRLGGRLARYTPESVAALITPINDDETPGKASRGHELEGNEDAHTSQA